MKAPYSTLSIDNYSATFKPMPAPKLKTAKDAPLVCVQFSEALVPYLLGLLEEYRWADKLVGTDLEVQQALSVFEHLRLLLATAKDDCDGGEVCRDYLPNSSIIEYAPQDPFKQPDYTPPGYTGPPFHVVSSDILAGLFTLEAGDVVTGINGAPVLTPAIGQGLARFRVRVKGSGTVELHLITLPFGGMAMITTSTPLTLPLFVDLVRDVSLIPPANNVVNIQEIEFDTDGEHYVDVTFLPSFGQTALFVGYGGGLRKVNLCGFEPMQGVGIGDRVGFSDCYFESEEEMRLRVKPNEPCVLQIECGDTWVDWYDPRPCLPGAIAQPTGQGALQPGQCKEFDVTLYGYDKYLLPVPVEAGYTIEITNATGGWSSATNTWWCPSGQGYVLGQCSGGNVPADSSYPLPGAYKGRLIAQVGNVFVDAYNTIIHVEAGVVASDVQFQMNDTQLEANQGSITFHVKVCAPAANSFTPETLSLVLTSQAGATKSTVQQTDVTKLYKITLSGEAFVNQGNNAKTDHFYATQDNWATHERLNFANVCGGAHPNTFIDGAEPNPYPDFVASHTYVLYKQGTGVAFTIKFCDVEPYADNGGSLTVLVEQA